MRSVDRTNPIPFGVVVMVVAATVLATTSCQTHVHQISYPDHDDVFITAGDDPGTESPTPYQPKGYLIHYASEFILPIPFLSVLIGPFGNADPRHVYETGVLPEVRRMGGDALSSMSVEYTPEPPFMMRLLVPFAVQPESVLITGQVNAR